MRIARRLFRLLGAALTLPVVACNVDSPPPTASVSAEVSTQQLKMVADAERARTASTALASQPAFDSLLASWSADQGLGDLVNGLLLQCRPLPYASDVQVVGPSGGLLRIGPHTLAIPAGALNQPVVITAESPVSQLAQVSFTPHGLTFDERYPPSLTLSYAHCDGLGASLPKHIVYVDDGLKILESLLSFDLPRDKSVSAPLSHFSGYVVAY